MLDLVIRQNCGSISCCPCWYTINDALLALSQTSTTVDRSSGGDLAGVVAATIAVPYVLHTLTTVFLLRKVLEGYEHVQWMDVHTRKCSDDTFGTAASVALLRCSWNSLSCGSHLLFDVCH